jgi:hypothetical protein
LSEVGGEQRTFEISKVEPKFEVEPRFEVVVIISVLM